MYSTKQKCFFFQNRIRKQNFNRIINMNCLLNSKFILILVNNIIIIEKCNSKF